MSPGKKRIKLSLSAEECWKDIKPGNNDSVDLSVKSPSSLECQQRFDERTVEAMNKVFGIDLLREKILGHLINGTDTVCKDICSARLVQKSWLRDVNKQLFKLNKPLIFLELGRKNSMLTSKYFRVHKKKMLDRFFDTMSNAMEGIIPPIDIKFNRLFFREENYQIFLDFLESDACARAVVNLNIVIPNYGGSMDLLFLEPSVWFPRLKNLTVEFCCKRIPYFLNESALVDNYGTNSNFVPIIQAILTGATDLDRLKITGKNISGYTLGRSLVPTGVKNLVFPNSLTNIHLELDINHMDVLVNKCFPNLTYLHLTVRKSEMGDEKLFQILDKVKATLRNLTLIDADFVDSPTAFYHQLPVMEHLEACEIRCAFIAVEKQDFPLETLLPELKQLELTFETATRIRNWPVGACFLTVTKLTVNFFDVGTKFSVENMQVIHKAFPNLKSFTFSGNGVQVSSLEYLLKEMRQLTELRIRTGAIGQESFDEWNALLIGVPVGLISSFKQTPGFWEMIESLDGVNGTSIKYMTALRILELSACRSLANFLAEPSIISDQTYRMTILQMPNLKLVELKGAFMPSPRMTNHLNMLKTRVGSNVFYNCHF